MDSGEEKDEEEAVDPAQIDAEVAELEAQLAALRAKKKKFLNKHNRRLFFITKFGFVLAGEDEEDKSDSYLETSFSRGIEFHPGLQVPGHCIGLCNPTCGCAPQVSNAVFQKDCEIPEDVLTRSGLSEADLRNVLTEVGACLERRSACHWGAGYTGPLCPCCAGSTQ